MLSGCCRVPLRVRKAGAFVRAPLGALGQQDLVEGRQHRHAALRRRRSSLAASVSRAQPGPGLSRSSFDSSRILGPASNSVATTGRRPASRGRSSVQISPRRIRRMSVSDTPYLAARWVAGSSELRIARTSRQSNGRCSSIKLARRVQDSHDLRDLQERPQRDSRAQVALAILQRVVVDQSAALFALLEHLPHRGQAPLLMESLESEHRRRWCVEPVRG